MMSLPVWLLGPKLPLGGSPSLVPCSFGGSLSEGICPEGLCLGGLSVMGVSVKGGLCQEGSLSGVSVWGASVERPPWNQKIGWYTSYWNAFLFHKLSHFLSSY